MKGMTELENYLGEDKQEVKTEKGGMTLESIIEGVNEAIASLADITRRIDELIESKATKTEDSTEIEEDSTEIVEEKEEVVNNG